LNPGTQRNTRQRKSRFSRKKAALHGVKPNFKIPYPDLFLEVRESLDRIFASYLNETARTKGILHASLYQNHISRSPWYYDKPLNRKEIVLVTELEATTIILITVCSVKT